MTGVFIKQRNLDTGRIPRAAGIMCQTKELPEARRETGLVPSPVSSKRTHPADTLMSES